MANSKARIAFVGVGAMGQCAHLKNYAMLPDCEVVACADIRAKTAASVARRYGIPAVYSDASDMIKKEKPDGLVASQPFARHGIILPEILASGIPVFIEKPLSNTVSTGQRLADAVHSSGSQLMVGYHKRCDPAIETAVERIKAYKASGLIGAMTYIRILMPSGDWQAGAFKDLIDEKDRVPNLPTDPADADLSANEFKSYESFVNYYIHQVNLMAFLLGEDWAVEYADPTGRVLAGRSVSGLPCVIEMTPYRTTIDWQESILIAFEKGWIKVSLPAPMALNRAGSVKIMEDPGGVQPVFIEPQLPWVHAMKRQAEIFLSIVRGERTPPCGATDALKDLKLAKDYILLKKKQS